MDAVEEPLKIPTHVGLIMDGNGRWATVKGLPRLAGHRAGVDKQSGVITGGITFGVN